MAATTTKKVFVWKGADGATNPNSPGATASESHYWNEATNWFIRETITDNLENFYEVLDGATSSGDDYYYVEANRIPAGGDEVIFTYLPNDPSIGLSGGPWPKSACLFGGFDYTNGTNEWHNAGGTGDDITGNLKKITVEKNYSCVGDMRLGYAYSTPFYWDGPLWQGLYIKADEFINRADCWGVALQKFEGLQWTDQGYAMTLINGGTASAFIFDSDYDSITADNVKHGGNYQKYIINNISEVVRFESNNVQEGRIELTVGDNLNSFIYSPNVSHAQCFVIGSRIQNLTINPFVGATEIGDHYGERRFTYPRILKTAAHSSCQIDNLFLSNMNPNYEEVNSTATNPGIVISNDCLVTNFVCDAGIAIAYKLGSTDQLHIINGSVNYGVLDLNNDGIFLNYILGPTGSPGISADSNGINVLNNQYEFRFGNGSVVKTFSGRATGEATPVDTILTTSNQSIRTLIQNNNVGISE